MPSDFVKQVSEFNHPTYFLLPLIELNKFSFGVGNFINSYVNQAGTALTIEVKDLRLCESFQNHPEYVDECVKDNRYFIRFSLPGKWAEDFKHFVHGRWSQFSDDAKQMAQMYSGLKYNVEEGDGYTTTDSRLLAFEKAAVLREQWEHEIGSHISDDMELLSIPYPASYMEIE
jgi:hypothetical protein